MDTLNWFKIQVVYPITSGIENEELSEIEKIQLMNEGILDDYETDYAYLNLAEDTIVHINPKAFIKKGNVNKRYFSEIVMKSGDVIFAVGKPEAVYTKVNEYLNNLP